MSVVTGSYIIKGLAILTAWCSISDDIYAQEIELPSSVAVINPVSECDNLIYAAREMYNSGELQEVLMTLKRCIENEDLSIRQRRTMYRLLAETHLFTRDYSSASEYARRLAEIDPKLQVYGISRLPSKGRRDLRTAIRSTQYVDAPDLLLLVGNIRYNAIGIELHTGISTQLLSVKERRLAPGVDEVRNEDWMSVRRLGIGVGVKYDPYKFPLGLLLRLNRSSVSFMYSESQEIDDTQALLTYRERQQWLSPELWMGYQFAPKKFPVRNFDLGLRAGASIDFLTGSFLESAFLEREAGADWSGGPERDIHNLISRKSYLSLLAALECDYRIGRQSVFAELQYRHPFVDEYVYDIEAAPYSSSVRSVHTIGLLVGVRWVFYKAFYK